MNSMAGQIEVQSIQRHLAAEASMILAEGQREFKQADPVLRK